MGLLKKLASSPPALLGCLIAGALLGHFLPEIGAKASLLGQLYLGVVAMAALPLLVVATFFGLRQTLALPQPGARILMIAGLAAVVVAASAAIGTLAGVLAEPGGGLDAGSRAYLGQLVQEAGRGGGDAEFALRDHGEAPAVKEPSAWNALVPDNFFRALADGRSLAILVGALLFGLAFAALGKTRNSALTAVFEAVYRALEIIISQVNLFIPVMVFSMAAFFVSRTEPGMLAAMGAFLGWFTVLALGLSVAAAAVIGRQCGASTWQVTQALQDPGLIALTSASATASIPSTIEAMSSRLGFSRGIVELVTPTASVFMRSGSALYYALVTLFVANLYGRTLLPHELLLVGAGSFLAAFASAGNNSAANVGYAGMVLGLLQLPVEAALALFLAIDLLCEGPRNLLTLMATCMLIALVSRGLPHEQRAVAVDGGLARPAAIRFVFTRADLVIGAACTLLVAILLVVLGIGIGLKRGSGHPPDLLVQPPAGMEKQV